MVKFNNSLPRKLEIFNLKYFSIVNIEKFSEFFGEYTSGLLSAVLN